MVEISVANQQIILPSGTEVHGEGILQGILAPHNYELFKREGDTALYMAFLATADPRSCLCDLLLVRYTTAEKIDEIVRKMDALTEQVRGTILRGKFMHPALTLQKHPFMRLHRPLIQFSYQHDGKAVGFHIRPILLVWDYTEPWDYFMGPTTRVDVLSIKRESLDYYLREHIAVLKNLQLVDLKKYRYSNIARRLIRFGHYPIIFLWLCFLGFTIGQAVFPLDLTGMFLLTIFPYLGMVGTVYLLHQCFAQRNRAELQEEAPFQSLARQGQPPAQARPDLTPRFEVTPEEPSAAQQPPEVILTPCRKELHPTSEEPPITKLQRVIREFILTQEPDAFAPIATRLMLSTLQLVLDQNHHELPKMELTLMELLKVVRPNPTFNPYFRPLSQWAKKLEAQTPFEQGEILNFKRFILRMLYQLQFLPSEVVEGMQKNGLIQKVQQSISISPPPAPTPVRSLPKATPTQPPMPPTPPARAPAPMVQSIGPPEPEVPDIEVDSQAEIDLPEINSIQYKQVCTRDPNGILCILLVDKQAPAIADLTQQFKLSIQDWDIQVYFADSTQFEEPSLTRELEEVTLPVVVIQNGMHRQILPYHGTQDDARLHSVLNSYQQRQADLLEPPSIREEKRSDSDEVPEPALISLKARPETPSITGPGPCANALETKEVASLPVEPAFDTSLPDSPKQNPAWHDILVLVDGMNLSFLFKDYQEAGDEPRLECIFLVLRALLAIGLPREQIVVYFDANIEERFKECERYEDLRAFKTYTSAQRIPKFRKVPGGIKADTALVALGNTSKRYIVVTNDGLREYPNIRQHRVGVSLDHQTNPLLLVESEADLSQIAEGTKKRREC